MRRTTCGGVRWASARWALSVAIAYIFCVRFHSPAGDNAVTLRTSPAWPSSSDSSPPSELPGDVRTVEAELGEELLEHHQRGLDAVTAGRLGRLAEAGQVDGDDVTMRREQRNHRRPRLTAVADAVDQHQRLTPARAVVDNVVHYPRVSPDRRKSYYRR